jgi:hypothetical protein
VRGARHRCGDTGRDGASAHEMSKSPHYSGNVGKVGAAQIGDYGGRENFGLNTCTYLTLKAGAGACAETFRATRCTSDGGSPL